MAAAKRGRFVMEMIISGRKHESSYFGLLEYGVFKLEACSGTRPTITTANFLWLGTRLNSLMPTTVLESTFLAPVQLLKLTRCSCES